MVRTISKDEFLEEAKARFGPHTRDWKVICPCCKTVQSIEDFEIAGVPGNKISKYLGFSCIGRFDESKGCN